MKVAEKYMFQSITALWAVMLLAFVSCDHNDKPRIDAFDSREATPVLLADTVTTLISDSGITRYRIKAVRWEIYDKAHPPYWEFPQGVYLERFDMDLQTEASLEADYAHYDEEAQIWELNGNVKALNLEGETFETQQLFWNQKVERVYSVSLIRITKETSIITGIGFESNQTMTKYTIRNPQGIFPIKEEGVQETDAEGDNSVQSIENEIIRE